MKTWIEPSPIEPPAELQEVVGGHPLLATILARRGIVTAGEALAFLNPSHYTPASPWDLPDLAAAVERLELAMRRGESIAVWGDFDVDGQTATALLTAVLRSLGARVTYHVPVRATESHGINAPMMTRLLDAGTALILSCDTGVASHEAIDLARRRGVPVIVTDHHDLPDQLPAALAVVNPKRLPPGHQLEALPGVGVAFKLAEALLERAAQTEQAAQYLDLVALGIVADVALQRGDVRYLLQRGLTQLRHTERLGLQAMMEIAGLQPLRITEDHVGYVLAPRLNALGRLADANPAVELLITNDPVRARVLATQMEGMNARRKLLTSQVLAGALAQIERDPALLDEPLLLLAHPDWPAGVIGIVASQLVDRYNRPVILITSPSGEMARGSARSVPGCNISAALTAHADLFTTFGGHPMAAGFSLEPALIPQVRRSLVRTVQSMLGQAKPEATLNVDAYLPLADLSTGLVEDLERLAPFGPGNPPLVLASRNLAIARYETLGRDGEHLLLVLEDEQRMQHRVIWWQGAGWPIPQGRFDLAYTVHATSYRGQPEIQIAWQDARPLEQTGVAELVKPTIEVVDYRQEEDPLACLVQLRAQGSVEVWAEGDARRLVDGRDRYQLQPAEALAIWTAPPGLRELMAALDVVSPQRVFLFGLEAGSDAIEPFLQRLAGLVKFALNQRQGRTSVPDLAAATAQTEDAVRHGLAWLQAKGHVIIGQEADGDLRLAAGDGSADGDPEGPAGALQASLAETAAYRRHFRRAEPEVLLAP